MQHLIDPLKNLWLSQKETEIYLALLQLGPSTPYQIAKKAGIKRPTAYVIAEELVEKWLIVHVPGEDKLRYIARSPDMFVEQQEERLAEAKKILPELRSFQKGSMEKPSMLYFEGVEGLRQAYQYKQKELHGKKIVGFFASVKTASPEVIEAFLEWNAYKERHSTKVYGITVDDDTIRPFSKFLNPSTTAIIAKFLPSEIYNANVSIESCDNRFVRICLIESVQTLIIESPQLANTISEIFTLTWKALEGKYDQPSAFYI